MRQSTDEVTTLAYDWILQRPDGAGFGATSHDRRRMAGSITFTPDLNLAPSDLLISEEMFPSRLQLRGSLGGGALASADLLSGKWRGASVRLLSSDWSKDADGVVICDGELGGVEVDGSKVSMEVDLLPAALRRQPCIQTSPECRAVLGDRHCRVDMRTRRRRVQVTAVEAETIIVSEAQTERFRLGRLRWISGAQCGVEQTVIASDARRLSLQDSEHHPAAIGDWAILSEGCDGRRATCAERFSNIRNFRGEPDLPGSEILMRFPGA